MSSQKQFLDKFTEILINIKNDFDSGQGDKYKDINYLNNLPAVKELLSSLHSSKKGGVQKREPSAYNLFVKNYQDFYGLTLTEASRQIKMKNLWIK